MAVRVTTLPEATVPPEAMALPPEVIAKVVVVDAGAAEARGARAQRAVTSDEETMIKAGKVIFTERLRSCPEI
jgi:hypothetical protein